MSLTANNFYNYRIKIQFEFAQIEKFFQQLDFQVLKCFI